LRLNYRNTREILAFAYGFARQYLDPTQSDEDRIPIVEPQAAGISGLEPVTKVLGSFEQELDYTTACIRKWRENGVPLSDIAVLYTTRTQGSQLARRLKLEEAFSNSIVVTVAPAAHASLQV